MQKFKQKVIHGKKIGRIIGFPTANLKLKKDFIKNGTYKINIVYNGVLYSGVGVAKNELKLFEAHILDFDKEIYGETLEIIILQKIRENKKFNSLEELKDQIKKDVKKAKETEIVVMTFGTFDLFHPGHIYFLKESKKYSSKLITIIARDKNVEKLKGKTSKSNEKIRLENVAKSKIPDLVLLGDEKNPKKWIDFYKPKIICLGYDQIGFSEVLVDYKNIEIIKIGSYKKDIYKSSKLSI